MQNRAPHTQAYLLRLREGQHGDEVQWYITVTDVQTGRQVGFPKIEMLVDFLNHEVDRVQDGEVRGGLSKPE